MIFNLPDLGEGLAEGEIHEWYVKPGDVVKVDQPLVSIETAKAVVDVPSPQAGRISKLYGNKGDIIKTHAPLIEFEGGSKDKGTVVGNLEESSTLLDESGIIIGTAEKTVTTIKAMPAVRTLAKQLNVDLNLVKPTGPNNQITAEDVKKFAGSKTSRLPGKVEALNGVRRAMSIAMTQSHQEIVPVTIIDDADITHFTEKTDISVSILKAIAAGVQAEPSLNAWYDGKNMERCLHAEVHIGLAMDTAEGLFVPVIKNVEKKSAPECRSAIDTFKKAVKERTIAPSDLQGATISLSNFGTIAGRYATPVVVPPMVAILGVGKIREIPAVHAGKIEIRRIMSLSLTFDHRAVTGGEATRFLAAVMKELEHS
jgi:pyruvate dehydrogenase E2 component (dihydrolipoamide acetyltransferase)